MKISVGPSIGGSAPTEDNSTQFWHIIDVNPKQLKISGPPTADSTTDSKNTTKTPAPTQALVKSGVYSIQPVAQSKYAATIGGATDTGAPVLTSPFKDDYPINQLVSVHFHRRIISAFLFASFLVQCTATRLAIRYYEPHWSLCSG